MCAMDFHLLSVPTIGKFPNKNDKRTSYDRVTDR